MPKVAAIQFAPVMGAKEDNLRRLALLVKEAAQQGAQLVVMPELAAVGYSFMNRTAAFAVAEPVDFDGLTMKVMLKLAAAFQVHLVWGMVEISSGSNQLFNTQVFISPDGFFQSYRKVNRWGNDYLWAAPGIGNPPIVTVDLGGAKTKVGLLICRDVRDKKDDEWNSFYEPGDADIVCLSANWGDGGFPATAWMEFAENNKTHLIVSNRYGKETANNFGEGGICVIQKDGFVHTEGLLWERDCVVVAEVD
jgi:predicted amidohydrolase